MSTGEHSTFPRQEREIAAAEQKREAESHCRAVQSQRGSCGSAPGGAGAWAWRELVGRDVQCRGQLFWEGVLQQDRLCSGYTHQSCCAGCALGRQMGPRLGWGHSHGAVVPAAGS